jgi:nucleotide sugar dehydrogenase
MLAQSLFSELFGRAPLPGREIVCVQGLGFVGAAMATAIAAARDPDGSPRFDVIGVELDNPRGRERVNKINAGSFPFSSPDRKLNEAVEVASRTKNIVATTNANAFGLARIAIVDVNLDVESVNGAAPQVDFTGFKEAMRTLGHELPAGSLVIVETTVPPGTCENIVAPVLREELVRRGMPDDAILLAHSYERVMPGPDYFDSVVNFWRVYAGHNDEAAARCEEFLTRVINVQKFPLRRLGSMTASEAAKVLENSYRAINIAFIDEWSRLAEAAGIDLYEVIDAIRMRPTHNNMREPGFGVGGYCLPKDPLFAPAAAAIFFKDKQIDFPFSRLAVDVNSRMPLANLDRIDGALGGLKNKSIMVLGVAYRSEVDDTRSAPAETFCREAIRRGALVACHDPYVRHWSELDLAVSDTLPDPSSADVVVFAVPHRAYRELDVLPWLRDAKPLLYDCDNVLSGQMRSKLRAAGIQVESAGRGMGL